MRGIDKDHLLKFEFFKIKKSMVKVFAGQSQKTIISFTDVSQRILYEASKAEGELLSLINSTISHEMRNPLNSIINQCKIF